MHYKFALEVPTTTTRDAPKSEVVNLTPGIVEQVMIEFPAGCAGLVGVRILRGLFQLWPLAADEWFVTDDFTIVFPDQFELVAGGDRLRLEAYNEDDTYTHTISFRFSIRPIIISEEAIMTQILNQLSSDVSEAVTSIAGSSEQVKALFLLMEQGIIPILHSMEKTQKETLEQVYAGKSLEEIATY